MGVVYDMLLVANRILQGKPLKEGKVARSWTRKIIKCNDYCSDSMKVGFHKTGRISKGILVVSDFNRVPLDAIQRVPQI